MQWPDPILCHKCVDCGPIVYRAFYLSMVFQQNSGHFNKIAGILTKRACISTKGQQKDAYFNKKSGYFNEKSVYFNKKNGHFNKKMRISTKRTGISTKMACIQKVNSIYILAKRAGISIEREGKKAHIELNYPKVSTSRL